MEHRAHAGHGEIGLHVLLVVPAEGADAVAGADAETAQRAGEPLGAIADLGEGRLAIPVALEGDDLAVAVDAAPVLVDHVEGERVLLHRALHGTYLHDSVLVLQHSLRRRIRTFDSIPRTFGSTSLDCSDAAAGALSSGRHGDCGRSRLGVVRLDRSSPPAIAP